MAVICLAGAAALDGPHASNDVYQALIRNGVTLAGTPIAFPQPLLHDGDSPDVERAALRKLAGSDGAVAELLRNSVTAPQILRLRDEKGTDGTLIRIAELWFAVHAELDEIDPARLGGRDDQGKPVEAGNMRFTTRRLGDDQLAQRKIERRDPKLEWYTHTSGNLLDRIHVESTEHVQGTKAADSWVFAGVTDRRFDDDPEYPNRWDALERGAEKKARGAARRFAGGASMTRISRLKSAPGVLLVEGHFAFAEPRAWFDGAPILRSKIALVAQDQIRRLRRELVQRRQAASQ
jgi:hypothetical protein